MYYDILRVVVRLNKWANLNIQGIVNYDTKKNTFILLGNWHIESNIDKVMVTIEIDQIPKLETLI